jgi:hypothetical protein
MARSRSKAKTEADLLDESPTLSLPGRVRKADDRDPREPLEVGNVEDAATVEAATPPDSRSAKNLSTIYARNLVATGGDVIKSLAITFAISEDEASDRFMELHQQARGASRSNLSIGDMLERHDLTTEVRLAKLREAVFHPDPRVSLKAVEMVGELDATSKSKRIGTTWESFVQRVRAGAGPRAMETARKSAKP